MICFIVAFPPQDTIIKNMQKTAVFAPPIKSINDFFYIRHRQEIKSLFSLTNVDSGFTTSVSKYSHAVSFILPDSMIGLKTVLANQKSP